MSSTLRRVKTIMTRLRPQLLRRVAAVTTALGIACLSTAPLQAQAQAQARPSRAQAWLDEAVALTASLEYLLVGVPGLSDAQRDSVEHLEQLLRDTVTVHGRKMLRARGSMSAWWSAEQTLHEREVNGIIAVRARAIDRLRATMTDDQRRYFDYNEKLLRNGEVGFWSAFGRGHFTTATLDAATTP